MPYIGNQHNVGDHVNNFKVLDDISSHTATFDGSATSVISTADNTIRIPEHRFIQGQRVTYTNGGGGNIGGLTTGTAYFVSFDSANTIKLATTLANANSNTVINLSAVGSGTSHTLNVAFDGVNTKFKMTHGSGKAARLNNATQLNVAINNVIQRPNLDPNNFTDGFALEDNHKIVFKTAPTVNDIFWGSIIANTIENFDLRDNEVDNFTGDGSTTEFTLSTIPANNESVIVSINGVVQHPSDKNTSRSYTLIESIIEFTAAPALGDEIQVRHIGFAGASTNDVSGFYGRTGNVALTSSDHITTGDITARNINSSGIVTASTFDGAFTGNVVGTSATFTGNLTVGGVLTYEDVTNIDSVGIITAKKDIHVGAGVSAVGVGTFGGGIFIDDSISHIGDSHTKIRFPTNDQISFENGGSESMRIYGYGQVLIGDGVDRRSGNAELTISGSSNVVLADNNALYNQQNPCFLHLSNANNSVDASETGIIFHNTFAASGNVALYSKKTGTYASDLIFRFRTGGTASTERVRITSSGQVKVGTGVTIETNGQATFTGIVTATELDISGNIDVDGSTTLDGLTVSEQSNFNDDVFVNVRGKKFKTSDWSIFNTTSGNALSINGGSADVVRVYINANGKIGVGGAPSAWEAATTSKAIQIGNACIFNYNDDYFHVGHNFYWDGSNYKYITSDWATRFLQANGEFSLLQASSGTANNNITWSEKLRIDSSGRVIIGKVMTAGTGPHYDDISINNSNQTGSGGSAGIDLISNAGQYGALVFSTNSDHEQGYVKFEHGGGVNKMRFGTLGTDRWQIYSGGNLQPAHDSSYDIGSDSVRVRNIYTDNFYATSLSYTGNTLKLGDGSAPSSTTYYDDIIIDNSDNVSGAAGGAGITLYSGTSSWGGLIFGDGDAHQQGYIKYSHQNDYMNFGIGGSERMIIERLGSIGITSAIHHINDSHTEFGFPSNDSFLLKVAGESRIYTHPSEAIWNRRDANAGITTQTMLINYNTAAGTGCAIGFAPSGVNYNARHSSIEVVNEGNNQMTMRFKVTDPSVNDHAIERMRINKDGKFCLGTFNANYASNDGVVSIVNAASTGTENPLLTLWNPTTVVDARAGIDFLTNAQYGTGRDGAFIRGSNDGVTAKAHIQFGTIKDETYTETLRLTSGGHLVIGGSTPPNQAANDGSLFLKNDATLGFLSQGGSLTFNAYYNGGWKYYTSGDAHILWGSGDGINLSMAGAGTANNAVSFSRAFQVTTTKTFHFGSQTSTTKYNDGVEGCSWYDEKKSWQQGQSGGIGWSMMYFNKKSGSDNRIMHFFNNGTTCGYINRVTDNTTQFATSSDYRLKKDVVALPNGIERVKQLRPVAFKWKSNNGDMEGFLAHEAQEIVPYAVSGKKDEVATDNHGDRKIGDMIVQGVDYGEFTPLLTAAMKELIAKVETLEAEVAALKGS